MNPEFLQKLLIEDPSSKVICQLNTNFSIDYLNLQTSTMAEVFSNFPEVILIMRCYNAEQRVLYTFLADGPRISPPFDETRMVHVAVPSDETPEGLGRMFLIMKELNPQWLSIHIFLVDPDFTDDNVIRKAFPYSQVVPSASHVYTRIQKRIHELFLPNKAENILLKALKNTMCSATPRNLRNMYNILEQFVDPRMFTHMKADWLLSDRIWALHRWRSWNDCTQYFEMIESLSRGLNAVFKISPCLIRTMNSFISFVFEQTAGKNLPEHRTCSPEEVAIIRCKVNTFGKINLEPEMEPETAALMCESLNNICNPAAFELCQNELEVAQKSRELVGNDEDKVSVQIFENPIEVSNGERKTCTCGFYQCTELPCRHILSVLSANEEIVQPAMVNTFWQKDTYGPTSIYSGSSDTLEILRAEVSHVSEKHLLVNSLTGQISTLLAECSDEVFQRRYNTLRELADAWIGPYEEVKL